MTEINVKGPEADRLMTVEEVERLKPNWAVDKREIFFEGADGERVFVPRTLFVHMYQRYSEIVAGMAATAKL